MSHLEEKHFVNRHDYIQAQADLIQKGLYGGLPVEDLIEKGGEGSKGGKVIGHTKSGKPIYAHNAMNIKHKDFTSEDHKDAAEINRKEASKHRDLAKKGGGLKAKANEELHNQFAHEHDKAAKGKEVEDKKVEKAEGDNFDGMFDKAESPEHKAKMEKVMAEFKAGTLKTSAGDKVTDRDQAIAIAMSEAKPIEKAMTAEAGERVTQKESVEHNPKDMQNAKPSDLKKAYEVLGLGDVIEKSEGSKGGKVIGHTKSGKPIYAGSVGGGYKSFSVEEHREAATILHKHARETAKNKDQENFLRKDAESHEVAAKRKDLGSKKKD